MKLLPRIMKNIVNFIEFFKKIIPINNSFKNKLVNFLHLKEIIYKKNTWDTLVIVKQCKIYLFCNY
jgi:hypothetical protein